MNRDVSKERAEIERAADKTLPQIFLDTVESHRQKSALNWKTPSGWKSLTWGEYRDVVRKIAVGLRTIGVRPHDFGVIMARNRPEHLIADLGIIHACATPVSLYNTLAPEQIEYIAGHCEATVAFVEDAGFLKKLLEVRSRLPRLANIVLLEPLVGVEAEGITTFDELVRRGQEQDARDRAAFDRSWREVTPDDLATLIYTSGTTGPPKGVMDTHRQVLAMLEISAKSLPTAPGHRHISYLPFAHAYERYIGHWHALRWASSTYFCPDPTQLFSYAAEVRPTSMTGVPRVWEKLHAALNAAIAAEPDAGKRAAVQGAIAVGRELVRHAQSGQPVPSELERSRERCRPIWEALRAKVGLDQCKWAVTGAAPINTEVIEFFQAIGLPMTEGWGMTETTVGATFAPTLDSHRNGTVGVADYGVEVRLASDNEILVRGPNVTKGYYKSPEQTAEAIDAEGWLHTGDVGSIDEDGYVRIIDRKKELIITAGGKNISPANLENLLKQHVLIGQACAIGDRRPFITALVVLDAEVLPQWCARQGVPFTSVADLSRAPQVAAEIQKAVDECNRHVSQVEAVRRFTILGVEWTAESEELTPTLKLKRRVIQEKYAGEIARMYA